MLGSDPEAGTTLRPGTVVDLVVSKGPRADHGARLDRPGRRPGRRQALRGQRTGGRARRAEYSDTVPEGHVISQAPASGTLFRGDTVSLVVCLGPELVEVPGGLIASGVDGATAEARGAGLRGRRPGGRRVHRPGLRLLGRPRLGSMVPRGSTITLYLI